MTSKEKFDVVLAGTEVILREVADRIAEIRASNPLNYDHYVRELETLSERTFQAVELVDETLTTHQEQIKEEESEEDGGDCPECGYWHDAQENCDSDEEE